MSAIFVTDPANQERVTLSELARRHGVHVSTLSRRYKEGVRGKALISKVNHMDHLADQNAKAKAAVERREAIMAANMAALSLPLKQLGGIRHA